MAKKLKKNKGSKKNTKFTGITAMQAQHGLFEISTKDYTRIQMALAYTKSELPAKIHGEISDIQSSLSKQIKRVAAEQKQKKLIGVETFTDTNVEVIDVSKIVSGNSTLKVAAPKKNKGKKKKPGKKPANPKNQVQTSEQTQVSH